ncbi:hypothetical protein R3P38DRAFT_2805608 [Favolaschia claudopus]|uniref:Uncharacterized protein n=1 Tax=Favolaschia claudopus TaxID=2862362 RepID=A0AAV9ZMY5_9AGAR
MLDKEGVASRLYLTDTAALKPPLASTTNRCAKGQGKRRWQQQGIAATASGEKAEGVLQRPEIWVLTSEGNEERGTAETSVLTKTRGRCVEKQLGHMHGSQEDGTAHCDELARVKRLRGVLARIDLAFRVVAYRECRHCNCGAVLGLNSQKHPECILMQPQHRPSRSLGPSLDSLRANATAALVAPQFHIEVQGEKELNNQVRIDYKPSATQYSGARSLEQHSEFMLSNDYEWTVVALPLRLTETEASGVNTDEDERGTTRSSSTGGHAAEPPKEPIVICTKTTRKRMTARGVNPSHVDGDRGSENEDDGAGSAALAIAAVKQARGRALTARS